MVRFYRLARARRRARTRWHRPSSAPTCSTRGDRLASVALEPSEDPPDPVLVLGRRSHPRHDRQVRTARVADVLDLDAVEFESRVDLVALARRAAQVAFVNMEEHGRAHLWCRAERRLVEHMARRAPRISAEPFG